MSAYTQQLILYQIGYKWSWSRCTCTCLRAGEMNGHSNMYTSESRAYFNWNWVIYILCMEWIACPQSSSNTKLLSILCRPKLDTSRIGDAGQHIPFWTVLLSAFWLILPIFFYKKEQQRGNSRRTQKDRSTNTWLFKSKRMYSQIKRQPRLELFGCKTSK